MSGFIAIVPLLKSVAGPRSSHSTPLRSFERRVRFLSSAHHGLLIAVAGRRSKLDAGFHLADSIHARPAASSRMAQNRKTFMGLTKTAHSGRWTIGSGSP